MAVALQDLERLQRAPVRPAQDAQERIAYLESIIAARDKELAYIKALGTSTKFDSSTKWFILAQRDFEQTEMPDENGLWRIDMAARATDMGSSPSTACRKTQLLVENDWLESTGPIPIIKKNGEEVPLVFGRLDPQLKTLEGITSLDDEKLRPWGVIAMTVPATVEAGSRFRYVSPQIKKSERVTPATKSRSAKW